MEIKVLIVEDEVIVADDLAESMKENGFKVSGIAISGEECLSFLSQNTPDIVILDINLKSSPDGIELAKTLNQSTRIPFIFLTANTDPLTVGRALPLNPCAYISKPFNKTDLKIAIELACQKHNSNVLQSLTHSPDVRSSIFVKDGTLYRRVEIASILYIEAKGSYCEIVTAVKSYVLSYNLNYFTNQVKNPVFKKIHRSYVVNINKVEGFDNTSVMINRKVLPVSKQYQKEILSIFLKL